MTPCPLCRHRPLSVWALLLLTVVMGLFQLTSGALMWTAARHYERMISADQRAVQWQQIADGMGKREVQRQLSDVRASMSSGKERKVKEGEGR